MQYTNNICYGLDVFQRGFGKCFVIVIFVLYLKPICEALHKEADVILIYLGDLITDVLILTFAYVFFH